MKFEIPNLKSDGCTKLEGVVAQILNLPYRRFSICRAWKSPEHAGKSNEVHVDGAPQQRPLPHCLSGGPV